VIKMYINLNITYFIVLFIILTSSVAHSEGYSGKISNPEFTLAWNIEKVSEKRIKLTGTIKNEGISDKEDLEFTARSIDSGGALSGEAKFRFAPVPLLSGKVAPFAMMIDVVDYETTAEIEFNIYYGVTSKDQIYIPQFSKISFKLEHNSKSEKLNMF